MPQVILSFGRPALAVKSKAISLFDQGFYHQAYAAYKSLIDREPHDLSVCFLNGEKRSNLLLS
jgi:hypothetical protein